MTVCRIMFFVRRLMIRGVGMFVVSSSCVLYHDGVSGPIGIGTPGGKFCTHMDGRRYVFSGVPLTASLSLLRICTLHIHPYVPAHRDFAGVGLSPISVRTICHNLPAYICESESFCVRSCASPIRWRNGRSNHNVRIGTAFLSVRTYV